MFSSRLQIERFAYTAEKKLHAVLRLQEFYRRKIATGNTLLLLIGLSYRSIYVYSAIKETVRPRNRSIWLRSSTSLLWTMALDRKPMPLGDKRMKKRSGIWNQRRVDKASTYKYIRSADKSDVFVKRSAHRPILQ